MPPLTFWTLVSSWVFDPLGLLLAASLACLYGALLWRAHRRGVRWPRARIAAFFVLGIVALIFATCGGLAAYRTTLFWAATTQAAVLSAVVPMGIALGDPVGLARSAWGEASVRRLLRLLRSPVARVLMFTLVSSVLAMLSLILVFVTGYFTLSTTSTLVREALYAQLLVTGSLVVLPILGEEMLPALCTHPIRVLFAFVDGLLDAVPGVVLITAPALLTRGVPGLTDRTWGPTPAWDQQVGGAALIAVTEVVGLPILATIIAAWVRADKAEARAVDAALDARAAESDEPEVTAPWWESDPRYSNRID